MATNLHRIQVLMSPELNADVKTLASMSRRSQSFVCNALIKHAMKDEQFQKMLEKAEKLELRLPVVEDPRTRINQPMCL